MSSSQFRDPVQGLSHYGSLGTTGVLAVQAAHRQVDDDGPATHRLARDMPHVPGVHPVRLRPARWADSCGTVPGPGRDLQQITAGLHTIDPYRGQLR